MTGKQHGWENVKWPGALCPHLLSLAHFEVVFLWMTPGRPKIGRLLLGMTMLLLNENFLPNTLTTQG